MPRSRAEEVREAVAEIRAFHATWSRMTTGMSVDDLKDWHLVRDLAEENGVSDSKVRQARQVAETYDDKDVEQLCRTVERVQSRQEGGLPVFGPTHLIRLMGVSPKARRKALQKEAIEQAWGCRRLELEILRRLGTRGKGGRRRKIPADLHGLLAQVENLCESWRRWRAELGREPEGDEEKHILLADLPVELRHLVDAASRAVGKLHADVVARLKEMDANWTPRTDSAATEISEKKSDGKKAPGRGSKS